MTHPAGAGFLPHAPAALFTVPKLLAAASKARPARDGWCCAGIDKACGPVLYYKKSNEHDPGINVEGGAPDEDWFRHAVEGEEDQDERRDTHCKMVFRN